MVRKSKFGSYYKQGHFHPKNKEKYKGKYPIMMRSSWEFKFAMWADRNPSIVSWGSESAVVRYFDPVSKRTRRYLIDFTMIVKDKAGNQKKYFIEIKPHKETIKPVKGRKSDKSFLYETLTYAKNTAKWEAAEKFAKGKGAKFIILTENELMI
jgi:hypothetical protein